MVPVPSLSPCHCHPRAIPVPVPSVPHAAVVPVPPHGTAIPMPLCSLCHWCCPRAITIPVPPLSPCLCGPRAITTPVPSLSLCHRRPHTTAVPVPSPPLRCCAPCAAAVHPRATTIPVPSPSRSHRRVPPRAPTPRALTPFPAPHFHRSPPPPPLSAPPAPHSAPLWGHRGHPTATCAAKGRCSPAADFGGTSPAPGGPGPPPRSSPHRGSGRGDALQLRLSPCRGGWGGTTRRDRSGRGTPSSHPPPPRASQTMGPSDTAGTAVGGGEGGGSGATAHP